MAPQEQALLNELFDRLAKLESNSRDRDAERLIADGLRQAPHAVYALVQTALVQDEALKLANQRIEELQAARSNREAAASSITCAMPFSARASREAPGHRLLSTTTRISPAGSRSGNWHEPGLWFGRVVSGYGRLNGGGCDRRRASAQQHPFNVR